MAFTTNGNVAEQFDVLESKLKLDQTVAKLFSIADTISDTMTKHSTKTSIFYIAILQDDLSSSSKV